MDSSRQGRSSVPSATTSAMQSPLRPGSPNTDGGRNPFGSDTPDTVSTHRQAGLGTNPFASPAGSRRASSSGFSAVRNPNQPVIHRYFHSRLLDGKHVDKPWMGKVEIKERLVNWIPFMGIFIGLGIAAFLVYDGVASVVHHDYCPVLDDDFSGGINPNIWTMEVESGGYGNGQFEITTTSSQNVFVDDGNLVIRATLQDEDKITQDTVIDLGEDGSCTSDVPTNCLTATNVTSGNSSIVNPAISGRINTKRGARIKYGRVDVWAKLPKGDWLWPAIWMLPADSVYGDWPRSGEIDIMESRGNNRTYGQGGNNIISSALHWGPDSNLDGWWKTNGKREALHTTYADGFNQFGLEWSQKYLFTYVNSRLLQVQYTNFNKPLWDRGNFPQTNENGTRIDNSWSETGRKQTPCDQEFYLILNLAVGGTNGWFEDVKSDKPWVNNSPNAKKDFWSSREQWLPTWKQPQLEVSRVRMQQQCDGNEGL